MEKEMELAVNQRLKFFRTNKGLSQKRVAEGLGVTQTYLSEVENERLKPSISLLNRYRKEFQLSPLWLLSGEGSMQLDDDKYIVGHVASETKSSYYKSNCRMISGNFLSQYLDSVREKQLPQLPRVDLSWLADTDLQAFEKMGDSMQPTLLHGDWAIGRKHNLPKEPWQSGQVYVLVTTHTIYISRLQMKRGRLVLKHDNPGYGDVELNDMEVNEAWLVEYRLGYLPAAVL
jgi:transcriptional regulator with XRE-family HTH domain